MPQVRLYKVGRSIVVTLPRQVRETARLLCGDLVQIESRPDGIWIQALEVRAVAPAPAAATDQDRRRSVLRGDE